MANRIRGSVEILRGNESIGVVGSQWVLEEVPIVLRNLHGIDQMEPEDASEHPSGAVPVHQWRGVDADNQAVTVMLWRDVPFEETYAAMIGPQLAEE